MKRFVLFKIYSQGRHMYEAYELSIRDNAHDIGKALVIWFNMTGGNKDGSFRRFDEVLKDKKYNNLKEYQDDPLVTPLGFKFRYDSIRPLNILGEDWHKLLDLKQYEYKEK